MRLREYFWIGEERSIKAKRNIAALLFRKGIGLGISLLLVPLTLSYLGPTRYGIWLTVTSVVSWMYFFDLGLGNGMRNKVAEALARGERELVRLYVSTAYAVLGVVAIALLIVFYSAWAFVPWWRLFNAPTSLAAEITTLVAVVFTFFCLQFITSLINALLLADQRPAAAGYLSTIGSALSLAAIFLLLQFGGRSLVNLAFTFGVANILPLIGASVYLFRSEYRQYAPCWLSIDFSRSRDIASLGLKFFFLQSAAIVIYSTDNMIITQMFGPEEVAVYGIAYKYMSLVTMLFGIVMTPFWSAFTDAYHSGDLPWISRAMRGLLRLWLVFACGTVLLVLIAEPVYRLWVGTTVKIPFAVTLTMGGYVIVNLWNNVFASFQNGIGVLRLQLFGAMVAAVTNIPLAILLAGPLGLGISGVLVATILGSLLPAVLSPIQYGKVMRGAATGIWGK